MEREIKPIVLHLIDGEEVHMMATHYGNWAVHQSIYPCTSGYSVTYAPRGLYVPNANGLSREHALRLAEALVKSVPVCETADHAREVKNLVESFALEARRVR